VYQPTCSCIQFLYQLDCTHVVTVEGLKYDGNLNPVQESMVRWHGAQCGFCTPGIIVNTCAMFDSCGCAAARETDAREMLIGNLCRCTGYEPIVRAVLDVEPTAMRSLNDLYPPKPIIDDLRSRESEPVLIHCRPQKYFKPVTTESAAKFKSENADCLIVSGGTDVGVQVNKGLREPTTVMSVSGLAGMREVRREDGMIVAGGAASIAELERVCRDALPDYARLLYWFGSAPIQAAATLGGNIANASPIGDTMPALFVLNAEVELAGRDGSRRVNLNDFYTGYKQTVMRTDELITRVFIPLPASDDIFKLYKVSRRKDLDISAFTAAFWLRVEDGRIREARIAYGGVGPLVQRLRQTEAYLSGAPWTIETVEEAGKLARAEIRPISDVRGSMVYRLQLAENVMLKLWHELDEERHGALARSGNGNGQA
jgi:xanthine dehydrogenase small subunit